MVMEFFKGRGASQVERIEEQIGEMLAICETTFEMAASALLGEADVAQIGQTLRKRDRNVNRTERAIRQELVVHAAVRGSAVEAPLILTYMSIAKDIERIGDYAKNIWDVASASHHSFATLPEADAFREHAARTTELIAKTAVIFRDRQTAEATETLSEVDGWLDEYDAIVEGQLDGDRPSREGVPIALVYRYVKRITAHCMNVLTSLVMPLDRIDFWDEAKADRWN